MLRPCRSTIHLPTFSLIDKCRDCYTGSLGCCEACAKTCHKGHRLEYVGISHAFCDCGFFFFRLSTNVYLSSTFYSEVDYNCKLIPRQCVQDSRKNAYQPCFKCNTCRVRNICLCCRKHCHRFALSIIGYHFYLQGP